ncbi:MAG: hypothetical protein JSS02_21290 [Planctomycetes bacterium]|nr:hypothetical protein [Planctomycetota bacterium]
MEKVGPLKIQVVYQPKTSAGPVYQRFYDARDSGMVLCFNCKLNEEAEWELFTLHADRIDKPDGVKCESAWKLRVPDRWKQGRWPKLASMDQKLATLVSQPQSYEFNAMIYVRPDGKFRGTWPEGR